MLRIVSVNAQRRLHTKSHSYLEWVARINPDILLVQEGCGKKPPTRLGKLYLVEGTGECAAYLADGYHASVRIRDDWWIEVEQQDFTAHGVCLASYPRARERQMKELRKGLPARQSGHVIMGDFNLIPEARDGQYGESTCDITYRYERVAFRQLLLNAHLVDLYRCQNPDNNEFTFERMRAGLLGSVRIDLALVSLDLIARSRLTLLHDLRRSLRISDHSAVCLDFDGISPPNPMP